MSSRRDVAQQMEAANDERIDELREKTRKIKDITLTINTYLENEKKNDLSKMKKTFAQQNPMLGKLIDSVSQLGRGQNCCVYLLLALAACALIGLLLII